MSEIKSPEFELIDTFEIDYIAFSRSYEVYSNHEGQYLVTGEDYETGNKTITFFEDFSTLSSVYDDDLEVEQIESWK